MRAARRGRIDVDDLVEICHGSPFDEDAYIFDELDAVRALKVPTRPLCLFGHTHYPITFELSDESFDTVGAASSAEMHVQMRDGCKYLMNPGSVGQPRDGDPRAAYAIVDTDAAPRRAVSRAVSGGRNAGEDHQGGTAGGARAAARGRTIADRRRQAGRLKARSGRPSTLRLSAFQPFSLAARRALSLRAASAPRANASRAARDPRIQPITMPTSRTAGMKMK